MLTQLKLEKVSFRHTYNSSWIFEDINLTLTPGLYGLLGPNGSGKSTLLKCIAGIYRTYQGDISFFLQNEKLLLQRFKERLGYVSQELAFYEEMKVETYLRYIADMKLLSRKQADESINHLLKHMEMDKFSKTIINTLSLGQRKRLMLIQALLADPHLILLDEPLDGLDIIERSRVMESLYELADQRVIILASHVITEIEHWIDQVIFMTSRQLLPPRTPAHWKTWMRHEQNKITDCLSHTPPTLEDVYLWVQKNY